MMKKMENGETVIGMLHHVIIGLWYRSCECTLSWTSDNEQRWRRNIGGDVGGHGASPNTTMICHRCGLHGHVMLDCRETVCTWCKRFGHFIENCPDLGWTFSNLGSSKLVRVVLQFHPQHVQFHFYISFLQISPEQHAMNACSSIFTFFHA